MKANILIAFHSTEPATNSGKAHIFHARPLGTKIIKILQNYDIEIKRSMTEISQELRNASAKGKMWRSTKQE